MKVVFSSDVFELQRFGGISRYFVEIASRINLLPGFQTKIATASHINSYLSKSSVNSGLYIPFSPSRVRVNKLMRVTNKIYSQSIGSKGYFDIRHETFYRGNIEYIKACKSVTTVYDLIREKFTPGWEGFQAKQKALARADAIICISESTASDLRSFYDVNPDKVSVIYLGVNSDFEKFRKTSEMKRDSNQFLYVGARDNYKDFKTLIWAFASSRILRENSRVLVFGNEFSKEELGLLNKFGIRKNFYHRKGNDFSLMNAYNDSIALVITSQYEGFGLPLIEAMISGCIVVSSRGGALAEIGGDLDIPFEVSNPESLAYSLESILSRIGKLEPLRELSYRHALKFTWEKTVEDTISVYRNLLSNV